MNIILTGASGTLGSQILIELLNKEHIKNIFLLVRAKNGKTALDRIKNILKISSQTNSNCENGLVKINVFDTDEFFTASYLNKSDINYFIHCAGYVNLSTKTKEKNRIFGENLGFTKKIFQTFSSYITKFTYISTAFSIGDVGGLIGNDFHNGIRPRHRNFYEESKYHSERYLLEAGKANNISIQILRPSVLGGNIGEKSKYFISKYMVYYLLGKFCFKNPHSEDTFRIKANFKTGLNIIPVDFVAKVIANVVFKNIQQLNITHSKCTNLVNGMKRIIETVDATNFTFVNALHVNEQLQNKNEAEKFYYDSLGVYLNPYLISKPYEYDTQLLESIVPIPNYDLEDYLEQTISYAKSKNFKNERW